MTEKNLTRVLIKCDVLEYSNSVLESNERNCGPVWLSWRKGCEFEAREESHENRWIDEKKIMTVKSATLLVFSIVNIFVCIAQFYMKTHF